MKGILIVLGGPNTDTGQLSEIARNRLDCAIGWYFSNPGFYIICTGGFGQHFNTTGTPHAVYAKRYLIEKHIPETAFLPYVLSSHTMEDALLARPLIDTYHPESIVVITSDFHMKRAMIIFNHVFATHNLRYVAAESTVDTSVLEKLAAHEVLAIERLQLQADKKA